MCLLSIVMNRWCIYPNLLETVVSSQTDQSINRITKRLPNRILTFPLTEWRGLWQGVVCMQSNGKQTDTAISLETISHRARVLIQLERWKMKNRFRMLWIKKGRIHWLTDSLATRQAIQLKCSCRSIHSLVGRCGQVSWPVTLSIHKSLN